MLDLPVFNDNDWHCEDVTILKSLELSTIPNCAYDSSDLHTCGFAGWSDHILNSRTSMHLNASWPSEHRTTCLCQRSWMRMISARNLSHRALSISVTPAPYIHESAASVRVSSHPRNTPSNANILNLRVHFWFFWCCPKLYLSATPICLLFDPSGAVRSSTCRQLIFACSSMI